MTTVLDASALIAFIRNEPGAEVVAPMIARGIVSAVNWTEVLNYGVRAGTPPEAVARLLVPQGLEIAVFGEEDARRTAGLAVVSRPHGLSLADRACLALAIRLQAPAVTADRQWARLRDAVPCPVQLIR